MPTHSTLRPVRILLLAWTAALTLLVILEIGSIPPSLAWALLPYLALVARQLIAPGDRAGAALRPAPAEPPGPPVEDRGPEVVPTPPEPGPEATGPDSKPAPARPSPSRPRRRSRPRPVAEPALAAWVEVAPGRYVRGEHPEPEAAPPPPVAEETPAGPIVEAEPPELTSESSSRPAD